MGDKRHLVENEIAGVLDCNVSDDDQLELEEIDSEDQEEDPEDIIFDEKFPDDDEDDDRIVESIRRVESSSNHQSNTSKQSSSNTKYDRKTSASSSKGSKNKRKKIENDEQNPQDGKASLVVEHEVDRYEGKDGYVWHTESTYKGKVPSRNIIYVKPGPCINVREAYTPIQCYKHFFTRDILQKIITHTNEEISQKKTSYKTPDVGSLKDLEYDELDAFLGILVLSAVLKDNHLPIKTMFDTDFSGDRYRATMSERRFTFLLECLRFDDKGTREERKKLTKLAAISEIWDVFIKNCKQSYKPGSYVTIDEQLVGFRGNCPFRMYIPNKPNKYGMKIVMMCDNSTNYMINAIPYLGKGTVPEKKPAADYFVEKLIEGTISGTNRNVTMDNWFTNVPLAQHLLKNCHLTVVGTIKKNKRELPGEFTNVKYNNRGLGSSMFLFHDKVTVVSYKAKSNKLVTLLSTMHADSAINESTKKPEIILTYNATKGSVDTLNQMCQATNCGRKTRRWPLCFFYNMINLAVINAYVIYVHNFYRMNNARDDKPLSRHNFMIKLHQELCENFQMARLQEPRLSLDLRKSIEKVLGTPSNTVIGSTEHGPRTYCKFCDWKKKRMTTTYCECGNAICKEHQRKKCPTCI